MARSTTDVSTENVNFPITITNSGTIVLWAKPLWNSGDSVQRYLWDTNNVDSPSFQRYLDNNIYAGFAGGGNTRVVIADTGLFTSGTWAHWAVTWSVAAGQTLYKDAASKGTSAFSSYAYGVASIYIANRSLASPAESFFGSFAEFAYWDTNLAAAEIRGYSPLFVRPGNMIAYLPLIGRSSPEIEIIGASGGTVTGTTTVPHPRIIMPRREGKRPWIPAETVSI